MTHEEYAAWLRRHPRRAAALAEYQGSSTVNQTLRVGKRAPVGALDRAFWRAPSVGGVVYRGVGAEFYRASTPGIRAARRERRPVEWVDLGFLSTSRTEDVAVGFGSGGLVMRLRIPDPIAAVHFRYAVEGYADEHGQSADDYWGEHEILFPRECRIRLYHFKTVDRTHRASGLLLPPLAESVSAVSEPVSLDEVFGDDHPW